jgi:Family of unknown function (DUF5343)
MAAALPYVRSPGNIERALTGIKSAATPTSVSQDFVKTILKIAGGPGNEMTSYLKKIGFTGTDGTPTEIYKKFRNDATEGQAAFEALKIGYKPLFVRNEYMHELPDDKLRGLIIEETGEEKDSRVVALVFSCVKNLKKFAKPGTAPAEAKADKALVPAKQDKEETTPPPRPDRLQRTLGMNLSYTINLNLPATSDVAVFNAIFKSLKDNLLKDSDG